MRELAAHYVQLITKEQRHGPYFLGGYSYGGLLAYEMASLMREHNHRVEFVAMIDTFPWVLQSRTVSSRLPSMQEHENSQRRHVEVCHYLGLKGESSVKKLSHIKMVFVALTEAYNTDKSCVMACLDIFRKTKTLCLRGYFTQKILFNFHLSFHRLICGMKHCLLIFSMVFCLIYA